MGAIKPEVLRLEFMSLTAAIGLQQVLRDLPGRGRNHADVRDLRQSAVKVGLIDRSQQLRICQRLVEEVSGVITVMT